MFCNSKKVQVAILHRKECLEANTRSDAPRDFIDEVSVKDKDYMIHLHAGENMNIDGNTVNWNILHMNIYVNNHIW